MQLKKACRQFSEEKNHNGSKERIPLIASSHKENPNKEQSSMSFSHRNCTMPPVAATLWQIYAPVRKTIL
jgi:hypothetical protein